MARDVLQTLFLWHCAFKETPRGMTANDLAEACLTDHEFFKKEDYVEFILGRLRDNQVIEYPSKDRGAFFRMSTVEGPNPVQILARIQRTQVQDPEAKQHWETLLTASAPQAGGLKMLKVLSWQWGPCGYDDGGGAPDGMWLEPGETIWLTATVQPLVSCPTPASMQFLITYSANRQDFSFTLPGFPDLESVPYSGCKGHS